MSQPRDVIIVGAGPAGMGIAALLRRSAVQDILVMDSHEVGASFMRWPEETRLITPSFFSNPFGQPDLNTVTPDSSLALFCGEEHAGGKAYASYLNAVREAYQIPVLAPARVVKVALLSSGHFRLTTETGEQFETRVLIWATGEFQFPDRHIFPGAEMCCHYADVSSWKDYGKGEYLVIGGYESAVDAAVNLLENGASVKMLTRSAPWSSSHISDPSVSLSPYTRERLNNAMHHPQFAIYEDADVCKVISTPGAGSAYEVHTTNGSVWTTDQVPILATGFQCGGGATQLSAFFEWNDDGYPVLTDQDSSTLFPGLYLVGPHVRHAGNIYCFIYKFRQRFPVVAESITRHLGLSSEGLRDWWALPPEPDCCAGDSCAC
ncbi:thioredoxin reductase [Shimwellia pseudoproteus]|uniref:NAD(P)/FAD-dependent oxidoreductase n=1 Tax=Shimwellia pseudoproteus TaxID=570012 RepID=UPI0018EA7726|nr:NAD(P)/FAD-dependent oxidoreductase [Shimwellia pseudoproteus]MBJ3814711.1 thioredoxin reductase [Shimwellia pseudoproteus]